MPGKTLENWFFLLGAKTLFPKDRVAVLGSSHIMFGPGRDPVVGRNFFFSAVRLTSCYCLPGVHGHLC
uniref:Uncharacterized protein n=1 Tax=Cynoglossus semilaevis TaxID=244447 RepID=A0A3P8WSN8_CYNSE